MSDSNTKANAPQGLKEQRERKARVNRIKIGIVLFLVIWLVACMVLDVVLMVRVSSLQNQIDLLAEKVIETMTAPPEQQTQDTQADDQETPAEESEPQEDTDTAANDDVRKCLAVEDNIRAEGEPMNVYLTFDDGPSENTPEILEILKRHNVKATFFVTGKEGDDVDAWYRQIVAEGHTLGMHSYSHKYSVLYDSLDSFKEDFTKLSDKLESVTGEKCWVYRFPGGSSNQVSNTDMNEFIDYLGEQGMTFYDWNVVCGDATSQIYTADELVQNVMKDVVKYKNSVVLMHDAAEKDSTVEALEIILQKLEEMDAQVLPITKESPVIHHHLN